MTLDELIAGLEEPRLIEIAGFLKRNLERARNLSAFHELMLSMRIIDTVLSQQMEIIKPLLQNSEGSFSEEVGEEMTRLWKEKLGSGPEFLQRTMHKEYRKFESYKTTLFREIPETIRMLQHSSVTASWSAFEIAASDTWITAVNARPELFGMRVFAAYEDAKEGFSSRRIELRLLAKYNFDLRHHVADIVSTRIDFTSPEEIKKAYIVAFDLNEEAQALLDSDNLRNLAFVRNLIAHRSGLVDAKFKDKTGCQEKIGDEFMISEETALFYSHIASNAAIALIKAAADALKE